MPGKLVRLRRVVEETDTVAGKVFDYAILGLILASVISFSVETLPDLTDQQQSNLFIFETFIVITFTVEYLLRVTVAENRLKYILSFYGVIDLLAILPYYLSLGFDLRSLRVLRFVRLLRL